MWSLDRYSPRLACLGGWSCQPKPCSWTWCITKMRRPRMISSKSVGWPAGMLERKGIQCLGWCSFFVISCVNLSNFVLAPAACHASDLLLPRQNERRRLDHQHTWKRRQCQPWSRWKPERRFSWHGQVAKLLRSLEWFWSFVEPLGESGLVPKARSFESYCVVTSLFSCVILDISRWFSGGIKPAHSKASPCKGKAGLHILIPRGCNAPAHIRPHPPTYLDHFGSISRKHALCIPMLTYMRLIQTNK